MSLVLSEGHRPHRATVRDRVLGVALASFIGIALAAVLFFGLSGAFRP
jgi:hypothetical protein